MNKNILVMVLSFVVTSMIVFCSDPKPEKDKYDGKEIGVGMGETKFIARVEAIKNGVTKGIIQLIGQQQYQNNKEAIDIRFFGTKRMRYQKMERFILKKDRGGYKPEGKSYKATWTVELNLPKLRNELKAMGLKVMK